MISTLFWRRLAPTLVQHYTSIPCRYYSERRFDLKFRRCFAQRSKVQKFSEIFLLVLPIVNNVVIFEIAWQDFEKQTSYSKTKIWRLIILELSDQIWLCHLHACAKTE